MNGSEANFNLIARPYRWLEYLAFGGALEKCRAHFLPQLSDSRRALVLGDGDGRFLAQLLKYNPHLHADAVDTSATMLQLLYQRCESAAPSIKTRICIHRANALTFPFEGSYDLIVTHFFLDCLTQPELDNLVARVLPTLAPGALWLISDFRIPSGTMCFPSQILIRSLYLAFRLLTGLRTTRLPDHATPLTRASLTRISQHQSLGDILTTELWQT